MSDELVALLDKHFPKGEHIPTPRGAAIVMVAEMLMVIQRKVGAEVIGLDDDPNDVVNVMIAMEHAAQREKLAHLMD